MCNKSRTGREKAEAQKNYEPANRELKQKIKQDKMEWYNALATQAEEAAAHRKHTPQESWQVNCNRLSVK